MERSEQNKHLVCNEDDDVDNGDDDNVDNSDDDGVDDGDEGADKYSTHLSQGTDYCRTERSKQKEHLVCNKDDDVDDGVVNSVDNGDDDGAEGADKHLTHLSQGTDCCMMESSEQNKCFVCNEDDDVDNGDDDSVDNGDDNGDDDGAEGADKNLTHLSQPTDCCRTEKSEQHKHLVCDKDNDVDVDVDDNIDAADEHLTHLT
eukprot:14890632-Ditylum_brightwellii.AAC.1